MNINGITLTPTQVDVNEGKLYLYLTDHVAQSLGWKTGQSITLTVHDDAYVIQIQKPEKTG